MKISSNTLANTREGLLRYLSQRPAFYGLIRTQEIALFQSHQHLINNPSLDVGSADGFFAQNALPTPITIGLDLPNMTKSTDPGVYNANITYDGTSMPLKDSCIKSIVSNCVFEHIEDIDAVLRECHRVLVPGGCMLTSVMTDQWESNSFIAKVIGEPYRKYMRSTQVHHNLFSRKKWHAISKKSGFKIVKSIGYLSPKVSKYLEFAHFISAPSLITKKVLGKWHVAPNWHQAFKVSEWIFHQAINDIDVDSKTASALFLVLQKT